MTLPLVRLSAVVAACLAIVACAGKPVIETSAPSIPEPVPVAAPPAPIEHVPVAVPEPASEPPAPQFADLLARMRAGFALGTVEQPRITREANWYAQHPEYIERTLTRAAPYLHHIVTEVEARNLPLELAVLPVIESAFEPYAYSRARASGLWQFIPGTGTRFGLKQDWWYDGRRDVVSATRAALDYLEFLAAEFDGDWLLAVAAYNCGEAAVARAIKANLKAGKPTDFWNLKLPAETRAYVPKLLAMVRLLAYPEDVGLEFSEIPNEPYFQRVETGGQIDLQVAAELAGISIEDLYSLNPAYHRWATDPTGPHFLLVPAEAADTFRQNLLLLTPDQRMRVERYDVRTGDTVASIATQFGTSPQVLRELNSLDATARIEIGTEMRVPSAVTTLPPKVVRAAALVDARGALRSGRGRDVHVVRRGDSLWTIARRNNMDVKTLASLNGLSTTGTLRAGQRLSLGGNKPAAQQLTTEKTADGRRVTYVVRQGDTLSSIARVLQVTVDSLRSWNELSNRSLIKPGQRLVAFVRERS